MRSMAAVVMMFMQLIASAVTAEEANHQVVLSGSPAPVPAADEAEQRVQVVDQDRPPPTHGGVELITGGSSKHGAARVTTLPVLD